MPGRVLRLIGSSALAAGVLTFAPTAQGHSAVSLSLAVTFSVNGTISVTLPDGTPVGTTSGAPTMIPAGYYTLSLSGPGGCTYVPLFELKGPGDDIFNDMTGGELNYTSIIAYFQPNSTYTWRNYGTPGVVYAFVTSPDVVGTPPTPVPSTPSSTNSTVSAQDVVGSATVRFRGTLFGGVSAAGRLTLAYNGKRVVKLTAGRYTITVTDDSATNGFLLETINHHALTVTGAAFVGKRSLSVDLTPGQWLFMPRLGKPTYSVVVS